MQGGVPQCHGMAGDGIHLHSCVASNYRYRTLPLRNRVRFLKRCCIMDRRASKSMLCEMPAALCEP